MELSILFLNYFLKIRWACDNWSACKAVELGTTKPDAMEVASRIADLVERLDINLEVVWRRRNCGMRLDFKEF